MIDGGLRSLFRQKLPQVHWQSIETGSTGLGVPDVNFCHGGVEGWVEFKITSGWSVRLRPEQVAWHERRTRAGGRTFVAVRRASQELWLIPGYQVRVLAAEGLRGLPGAPRWAGGPGSWNWPEIFRVLVK